MTASLGRVLSAPHSAVRAPGGGAAPRSGKAGRMPPPTGGQPLDPVSRAVRSVRLTVPTDRLTETAAGLQEFPPGAIKFSVTTGKVYFTV